ncbi:MAG: AzlD domain-containing protein [Pseudomonadota bacterium]
MVDASSAYLAIGLMALVTLGTRIGGAYVMRFVPLSARVERFLEAMSSSVLAAIVVTFVARGSLRELSAVAVAILVMVAIRSPVWAMIAAMAFAGGWSMLAG